jgi:hypothetical protein
MGGLVGFKKQPSNVVSRKQNQKMWNKMFVGQVSLGNIDKDFVDDRDFSTTYTEYGEFFSSEQGGNDHGHQISTPTSHGDE